MQIGWKRNMAALVAFTAVLFTGTPPMAQDKPFPEVDQQFQTLKDQFNADVGKVRLLLILDPT